MSQPINPEPDPGRRAGTPSTPTPEDPRQNEPIHDPPVDPEHDIERPEPVRQAGGGTERGVQADDPHPDDVVIDANETEH